MASESEFRRLIADPAAVLLADGAAGTRFAELGIPEAEIPGLPLSAPDRVADLHLEYLQAGARVLETHSFVGNASKLALLGLPLDVYQLNRRAAQIARHARDTYGEPAWILGSIGPLGRPVTTTGVSGIDPEAALDLYREQVRGLLAGGVDGFFVETLSDLGTAKAAWQAIHEVSDLPVGLSFSFSVEGVTLFGLTPEDVAVAIRDWKGGVPELLGVNCGTGPSPLLDAVLRIAPLLQNLGIRLVARPNAGLAQVQSQKVLYPASPLYMARLVPALLAAGAFMVGGCCGTTPEHIAAMGQAIHERNPAAETQAGAVVVVPETTPADPGERDPERSALQRGLEAGKFMISVELDPPKGINPRRLLAAAERLAAAGVDVINVGDSPMARVRMSAIASSSLIRQTTGLDVILHFTTRDRNLMGLGSDLLGAHALGIRNVLCLTGDPPGLGDYAKATAVYDLDSIGLVRVLAGLNMGYDGFGHQIGAPGRFFIGVGANPNADDLPHEIDRLRQKIEAGAQFIMTQPLYDVTQFQRWRDAAGSINIPILLGIMPLISSKQAEYLHHEVPGIDIPEALRARMAVAGADGERAGQAIAADFLRQVRPLVQGIYLVPSFNRVEPLFPLIAAQRN